MAQRTPRKTRNDGEGSVYYRADRDHWVGSIVIGWRDGKPIRRKVSGPTKRAAAQKLKKLRDAHLDGLVPTNRPMTVERWMTHWLNDIAPRRVRELTLASYRGKVEHYIIPLLGHHRVDRLTPEHIEAAWDRLRTVGNPHADEPKPLSSATILQTHAILRRALKVAGQRGHLATNPAATTSMDAPRLERREMGTLTVDEAKRVLAKAATIRNGARYTVALSLGLRRSEALGLRWADVDLSAGVIHVTCGLARITGKGLVLQDLKNKSSERDIVMPAPVVKALRKHRTAQRKEKLAAGDFYDDADFVFADLRGKPIDPARDSKAWAALLESIGVPHRRLHDARHTAATLLLLQGVAPRVAMQILGHSQITTTMRYQHVVDEMQRDAATRMGQVLWG